VNGCRVPAGAVVCVSPFVTQRHPAFWAEPEAFDPDRFAPDVTRHRPKGAFFPFGAGPRYCVGQAFAVMEMLLVVATILPQWHFRLTSDAPVRPRVSGTLRPEFGLPMTIEPAGAAHAAPGPDVATA
jgi:cytochrome P450